MRLSKIKNQKRKLGQNEFEMEENGCFAAFITEAVRERERERERGEREQPSSE